MRSHTLSFSLFGELKLPTDGYHLKPKLKLQIETNAIYTPRLLFPTNFVKIDREISRQEHLLSYCFDAN